MLFNSVAFLFFLPIVTILYFLLAEKFRNAWLLIASCFFYMYLVPYYILIVLCIITVDYIAGIWIEKAEGKYRQYFFYASILTNCSILFVFKYFNFFNENIIYLSQVLHFNWQVNMLKLVLPLGISFQTFQSMSYVMDVYKNKIKAEKNFLTYALFVMFFPQLVAGPIERAGNLLPQFYRKQVLSFKRVQYGLWLILWGLFQKVVIADRLAMIVNVVYNDVHHFKGLSLMLVTFLFFIQIYCDFSGYSDIAVGSARILGFDISTNFNAPFISKTVNEFWTRWHITLMQWFRSYVFYPLNRKLGRKYISLSLFIVFLLSGLWHGASWNFIIFGAMNGFYILAGSYIRKKKSIKLPRSAVITFCLVCLTSIFFRANSFNDAIYILTNLFNFKAQMGLEQFISALSMTYFDFTLDLLLACFIILVQYGFVRHNMHYEKMFDLPDRLPMWGKLVLYYGVILGVLFLGEFNAESFIYFQF